MSKPKIYLTTEEGKVAIVKDSIVAVDEDVAICGEMIKARVFTLVKGVWYCVFESYDEIMKSL